MAAEDLTGEITDCLREAMRLSISAEGNRTGGYALIVRATLDPDGTFIVDWQRYYSPPDAPSEDSGQRR